eukprot:2661920-Rhodomonas_salina.1
MCWSVLPLLLPLESASLPFMSAALPFMSAALTRGWMAGNKNRSQEEAQKLAAAEQYLTKR